jgi:prophage regulatory protein
MEERFERLPKVMDRTGLCRSAIFAGQKEGTFPKAVKIHGRATGWIASEVDAWIQKRISASRSAAA